MPDTQTPDPSAPAPPSAPNPAGPPEGRAGLAGLRKMSTTAGVGTGDYAAVSPTAVVALVVALLGGVAFLATPLVAIPVIGVACGVLALWQIARSNGTQTGRPLAALAIVVGLGVVAGVVGGRWAFHARAAPEQRAILATLGEFDRKLAARDYAGAYQLFTPTFRKRVKEEQFVRTFVQFEGLPEVGGIAGVGWNERIEFGEFAQGRFAEAAVGGIFKYRNKPDNDTRQQVNFAFTDGSWRISDIPTLFPTRQQ